MPSVAMTKVRPSDLSFRVLQADPEGISPEQAARAVTQYLQRKRAGLAGAVEVSVGTGCVTIRARGEAPWEMIREVEELLGIGVELRPEGEIEVDPAEFVVKAFDVPNVEPDLERELLHSRARYFPYPVCEWFEINTGELSLTDRRIFYEPEWTLVEEDSLREAGQHLIPLAQVQDVKCSEWWDIPCLLVITRELTYRYGWPAERGEPETIFDVDEWLVCLRSLLAKG